MTTQSTSSHYSSPFILCTEPTPPRTSTIRKGTPRGRFDVCHRLSASGQNYFGWPQGDFLASWLFWVIRIGSTLMTRGAKEDKIRGTICMDWWGEMKTDQFTFLQHRKMLRPEDYLRVDKRRKVTAVLISPSFLEACCCENVETKNVCDTNWARHQNRKPEIHFSSWSNLPKIQRKVQQSRVLQNWTFTRSHRFLPLFLSTQRWKDLSCCFLLLHYLLPCGALLADFISDFAGCFFWGGSLWNVFLTPNNPFPAFSHLLQLPLLSRLKKKKKGKPWFSKRVEKLSEANIHSILS